MEVVGGGKIESPVFCSAFYPLDQDWVQDAVNLLLQQQYHLCLINLLSMQNMLFP